MERLPSRVAPLSSERVALQVTIDRATYDDLCKAKALLSHAIPNGDVSKVLSRALRTLVEKLEKRRFAASDRPARGRVSEGDTRHVPKGVRDAVWKRDGGRCTFVGDSGRRCEACDHIEFDHVVPVARGGRSTIANVRLRCRAHNQYEAERTFGAEFMSGKREQARRSAAEKRSTSKSETRRVANGSGSGNREECENDVIPWLRRLGFSAVESREAAKLCEAVPDATLESRIRVALSYFAQRLGRKVAADGSPKFSGASGMSSC